MNDVNRNYKELANAIVLQAVDDYKDGYKYYKRASDKLEKIKEKYSDIDFSFNGLDNVRKAQELMRMSDEEREKAIIEMERFKKYQVEVSVQESEMFKAERLIRDSIEFFLGEWIMSLTHIKGTEIKAELDKQLVNDGFTLINE